VTSTAIDPTIVVRTIDVRNTTIVVREVGEGPILGYLHGMLGNPDVHPFLAALASDHRVIAPCLPGFNESPPSFDLRDLFDWVSLTSEVIDLCGIGRGTTVASSVGAMLALEVGAIRPEAFEQLVLLAPLGLWDPDKPVLDLFAERGSQQAAKIVADPTRAAAFFEDDASLAADDLAERGIDRYHTRRTVAQLVWPLPEFGLVDRIHRVTCPVGLVWGADDQIIDPAYASLYADRLAGHTETVVVEGAGHAVEWDRPAETADAVRRLARLVSS
jgi:pimeloyl-ACP methyl ester carboxylesterase